MSTAELQPVLDALGELKSDVADIKLTLARADGENLSAKVNDLEKRVRVLERWCWGLAGGLGLLGVLVAFVAKLLP